MRNQGLPKARGKLLAAERLTVGCARADACVGTLRVWRKCLRTRAGAKVQTTPPLLHPPPTLAQERAFYTVLSMLSWSQCGPRLLSTEVCVVVRIKPRVSCTSGKHSTSDLSPALFFLDSISSV